LDQIAEQPGLGLPTDFDAMSVRDRLIWSMPRAVAELGRDRVTAADVAVRAGVPTAFFHDEFASVDECLLAAYDRVVDLLVSYVEQAYGRGEDWPASVRLGLEAFLQALAAEPEVVRMATVEVPTTGADAQALYRRAVGRFQRFFREGRRHAPRGHELPEDVELMAVGGAEAIIVDEVVADRVSRLPRMLPEILFALLVPYLGPTRAVEEMRVAAQA
jgi:AcrR family transcriptional regulator